MQNAHSIPGGKKLTVALPNGLTVVAINALVGPHCAGFIEGDASVTYSYKGPQGHFLFKYEDRDLRLINCPEGVAHVTPGLPGEVHFAFHGLSAGTTSFAFERSS